MNEFALKARLKAIALEKDMTFNQVWKQLLLERFLARLANSEFRESFIFKGGLLLAHYLTIGRETIDIDFSLKNIDREIQNMNRIISKICSTDVNDGMQFELKNISELTLPHMEYTGLRASLRAKFGKMTDTIQVDIAFGDEINPITEQYHPFEYKGIPLFIGNITLCVYPVNAIFAEKLESVISKGATNSRMKDYHDLLLLTRHSELLDSQNLNETIQSVFKQRKTQLDPPIQIDNKTTLKLQPLWSNHLRGLGNFQKKLELPAQLEDAVNEINSWVNNNLAVTSAVAESN